MAKNTEEIAQEEVANAELVSLKTTKEEKKARQEKYANGPSVGPSEDEYPYCTRIDLDDDVLKKLNLKSLPDVGDELTLTAKVEVIRTSENQENGEKTRRSVCLQITRMSLS